MEHPVRMSNLSKKPFFLAAAVLAASLSLQVFSQKTIEIEGHLIDANDKPLRNGKITILYDPPLPPASFEELIVSWSPLDDGLFGMVVTWYPGRKIMVLAEDRPDGFYPIHNTSALIHETIFKGAIVSKFVRSKNLHRVNSYIKYGKAVIDTNHCHDTFVKNILKHQIFLKVTNPSGMVVANGSFKPAYAKQSGQLTFNLPEGLWNLEFYDYATKQPVGQPFEVTISPYQTLQVTNLKGC
jgi:hypothetical protein